MHISGKKRMERKGMVSETSFDKRFALGRNVDQDRITAKLNKKKGELTVETPKLKEIDGTDKIKTISIVEELLLASRRPPLVFMYIVTDNMW